MDIAVEIRILFFYICHTFNPPILKGPWALTSHVPKSATGKGRGWGGHGCDSGGGGHGGHDGGHSSGGDDGQNKNV